MDLRGLRAKVGEINFAVHGVPATVTVPLGAPVTTRIIWLEPSTEMRPAGADMRRAEQRRALAIRRSAVPAVPRGTVIVIDGDSWRVDSMEELASDRHHVVVLPVAAP